MPFYTEYPLYVVVIKDPHDDIITTDLQDAETGVKAKGVPIFTDREGAEEFRDRYHPAYKVGQLQDDTALAKLLKYLKRHDVTIVAFDPYKIGKRTQSVSIDEVLEGL